MDIHGSEGTLEWKQLYLACVLEQVVIEELVWVMGPIHWLGIDV